MRGEEDFFSVASTTPLVAIISVSQGCSNPEQSLMEGQTFNS